MRWLPKDVGTWGLILAIAALILAVPLNIASNIITSKVKDWWAARSIASLKKRIEKLDGSLSKVEAIPVLSPFEHCVLYGIARVGWLVMSVGSLIIGLVIILSLWYEIAGNRIPDFVFACLFLLTLVKMIIHAKVANSLNTPLVTGTEKGRAELRESIAKLKAKLAAKV